MHRLAPEYYAENGPSPPHPGFVSVLERAPAAEDTAAEEHACLAAAVASAIGVAIERAHITDEAPAPGRQSFGGKFVK